MGRKAINKDRKALNQKTEKWIRDLLPLLQDKPLDKLTLDQISSLIGKSKSTIYSYFTTKEEIYQNAIQLILKDLEPVIARDAVIGNNMEKLYRILFMKISEGIEGLSISFLEQIKMYYPSTWKIVEEFIDQLLRNFAELYKKGMETGEFKSFNIELLMAMDNHFVMSIMTNSEKFSTEGMTLNDLVTEYLDLRIRSLKA